MKNERHLSSFSFSKLWKNNAAIILFNPVVQGRPIELMEVLLIMTNLQSPSDVTVTRQNTQLHTQHMGPHSDI